MRNKFEKQIVHIAGVRCGAGRGGERGVDKFRKWTMSDQLCQHEVNSNVFSPFYLVTLCKHKRSQGRLRRPLIFA